MYMPPHTPFLRVPLWILQAGAKPSDAVVYAALLDWYRQNPEEGSPNLAWIMSRVGIGKRSLMQGLDRLESSGFIKRVRRRGTRSGYAFSLPPEAATSGAKTAPQVVLEEHQCSNGTGAKTAPAVVPKQHQTGAKTAPQQRREILKEPPPTPPKGAPASEIRGVFDHWASVHEKPKAKLTKDRAAKVKARLAEGYTVEQLKQAIDGCKLSRFHMGDNLNGQPYNDLATILRNGQTTDAHIERANGSVVAVSSNPTWQPAKPAEIDPTPQPRRRGSA